ncbi:MAG: hypothetical protein MAG431_00559 [Chloroflexi bacterium]|nr:hypothetical protein [Chloroflexota bacterium]
MRAALRAGHGLGVEAAVERVFVLPGAGRAHGKGRHGGLGSVVGDILDDGKTRPAVGAIDEGVTVAEVVGVKEFPEAIVADADIGGYGLEGVGQGLGVDDFESGEPVGRVLLPRDGVDLGQWWGLLHQGAVKSLQMVGLSFHLDIYPRRGVAHPTGQI